MIALIISLPLEYEDHLELNASIIEMDLIHNLNTFLSSLYHLLY